MSPELFAWNPKRRLRKGPMRLIARPVPLNNFGDLLGPLVVRKLLQRDGYTNPQGMRRLFSIGSVIHFAADGDLVWGSGINGKVDSSEYKFKTLDVRAVRGPMTRSFLSKMGVTAPEVYGDPGLLVPSLFPEIVSKSQRKEREYCVVPNFNDYTPGRTDDFYVNPRNDVWGTIETIATSEFVMGSSLHAIILAEALGVPCRRIGSPQETDFKYDDYYMGTGRTVPATAETEDEALRLGGSEPLTWDPQPLLSAFPYDVFVKLNDTKS